MPRAQSLEELLRSQSPELPLTLFLIDLASSALLGYLLGRLYARYGKSLGNRRAFAGNFVLLTVTTMLVISVVKSSLALSLGLVGALSIVRFRAAIKEPEELTYLFLAIAIGLGFGANQRLVTFAAFLFIAALILLKARFAAADDRQNLYLTVSSREPTAIGLGAVVRVLNEHCTSVSVTRFDEASDSLEASFLIDVDDFASLEAAKSALKSLGDHVVVSFVEPRGIA